MDGTDWWTGGRGGLWNLGQRGLADGADYEILDGADWGERGGRGEGGRMDRAWGGVRGVLGSLGRACQRIGQTDWDVYIQVD